MISKILKNQLEKDNIFHAYIFEGDKNTVREEYLDFSKKVLNADIDINNIIQVIKPKNENISIDTIRLLNRFAYEKPAKYSYKIFVIEDAHYMRDESQNAILKTLEELPKYTIVIMTTDNRFKLLDTIISRCQIIDLKGENIPDFDKSLYEDLSYIISKVLDGRVYSVFKEKDKIKYLSEYKNDTLSMLVKLVSDSILGIYSINNKNYYSLVDRLSLISNNKLEELLLKLESINGLLRVNINFQIALESILLDLARMCKE